MKYFIKVILLFIIIYTISSCSIFEKDLEVDQSYIDIFHGVEESGRLKRELHFGSSDDASVNSDIEFYYEENRLV